MERFTFILACLVVMALAAPVQAGDLIVVEEQAPNLVVEKQALTPNDRSTLQRLIGEACYQRGRWKDDFKEASARTGQNSARIYCDCMAPVMAQQMSIATIKSMVKTRQMDPALQEAILPEVRQCLQRAGYQY